MGGSVSRIIYCVATTVEIELEGSVHYKIAAASN